MGGELGQFFPSTKSLVAQFPQGHSMLINESSSSDRYESCEMYVFVLVRRDSPSVYRDNMFHLIIFPFHLLCMYLTNLYIHCKSLTKRSFQMNVAWSQKVLGRRLMRLDEYIGGSIGIGNGSASRYIKVCVVYIASKFPAP